VIVVVVVVEVCRVCWQRSGAEGDGDEVVGVCQVYVVGVDLGKLVVLERPGVAEGAVLVGFRLLLRGLLGWLVVVVVVVVMHGGLACRPGKRGASLREVQGDVGEQ
jgi:hypothetical protein